MRAGFGAVAALWAVGFAAGRLESRVVELGLSDGLRTEVLGGLEEGEVVAVVDGSAAGGR